MQYNDHMQCDFRYKNENQNCQQQEITSPLTITEAKTTA